MLQLRKLPTFIPILLLALAFFTIGTSVAAAQALSVDFEAEPLFLDADVKPGDSTARTVTVSNSGGASEEVYMLAENTFNDGLADVMELVVSDSTTTYFSGNFATFFASGGVDLGSLAGGDSLTYTFTASLPIGTGNEYQLSSFGFDLRVGFRNGESVTDGDGGTSGGRSGGRSPLVISNERVAVLGDRATLTWTTNRPATSYVVCGDLTDGPFTLTTEFPTFGYQFVLPEQTALVSQHSLAQTGLAAGEYECRPASRERVSDRFTIGAPLRFAIVAGEVAGIEVSMPPAVSRPTQPPGSVLGAGWKKGIGPTYDEWRAQVDRERAERAKQAELERTQLDELAMPTEQATAADQLAAADEARLFNAIEQWLRGQSGLVWGGIFILALVLLYAIRRFRQS